MVYICYSNIERYNEKIAKTINGDLMLRKSVIDTAVSAHYI
jgi:hypothetical protein